MNLDHLKVLTDTIAAARPEQCIMGSWEKSLGSDCGSAYCIGGWAGLLAQSWAGTTTLANYLNITQDEACYITRCQIRGRCIQDEFDLLHPADRKKIMLEVLRIMPMMSAWMVWECAWKTVSPETLPEWAK